MEKYEILTKLQISQNPLAHTHLSNVIINFYNILTFVIEHYS